MLYLAAMQNKKYLAARALKFWSSANKQKLLLGCASASRRVRAWSEAFYMKLLAERVRASITTEPKQFQDDVYHNPEAIKLISDLAQVAGTLSLAEVRRAALDGWLAVFSTPARDVAYATPDELSRIAGTLTTVAQRLNGYDENSSVPPYPYVAPHGTFTLPRHKKAVGVYPSEGATHVVALTGSPNIEVRLTERVWADLEAGSITPREVVFTWKRASKRMFARAEARNSEAKKFAPYFHNDCYLVISVRMELTEQTVASHVTAMPSGNAAVATMSPWRLIPTDQPFSVPSAKLAALEPERSYQQDRLLRKSFKQAAGIGDQWIVDSAVAEFPTLYKNLYLGVCEAAAAVRLDYKAPAWSISDGCLRELSYVTNLLDEHDSAACKS